MTGQRFGRLTVIERDGSYHGLAAWLCRCECGSWVTVSGLSLRRNATKSCRCISREKTVARNLARALPPQERRRRRLEIARRHAKNVAAVLGQSYVRNTLTQRSRLRHADIPPALVQVKRAHLLVARKLREETP
jgi:hypothetical protein